MDDDDRAQARALIGEWEARRQREVDSGLEDWLFLMAAGISPNRLADQRGDTT